MEPGDSCSLIVFTRDLRIRDLPALQASIEASPKVITAFILDDDLLESLSSAPNRLSFLLDSLCDLRDSIRELGGELVLRRGNWVVEVARLVSETGASSVHMSQDVSAFARSRMDQLTASLADSSCKIQLHPGVTVLPPGTNSPGTGGFWKVFTPYYNKWIEARWRDVLPPPKQIHHLAGIPTLSVPALSELSVSATSPNLATGGESAGLERLKIWAKSSLQTYEENHNALALDDSSRIAPYLHFGCLSPLEVAARLQGRPGAAPFIRQLCWRDFYHQALSARPEISQVDYRNRGDVWRQDEQDAEAWRQGRTGYPLVDAAMQQLLLEGFMHNRARMVVASFLTKDLYLDWRIGAAHFMKFLADADVANNQLNWQWTAGTGSDTNPNRIFNPTVQSVRFDPDGGYIRRYLPALAGLEAPLIHDPDIETRRLLGYPEKMVDHKLAIEAYRAQLASYKSS